VNREEKAVQSFLRSKGLHVRRIPEAPELSERRPDFLVESDSVLEIKSRGDQKFLDLLESLIPGEKTLSLGRRNAISSIVEDGVDQLSSYKEGVDRFRVIWFFINATPFSHLIARQIVYTVYGLMELEGYTLDNNWYETGCFYLTYNDFYRYRQLDAIVTQRAGEIALCLNDFSPHYQDFHTSSLHRLAEVEDWILFDPPRMEQEGYCFTAADCDLDRDNQAPVLDYIAKHYGLRQVVALDTYLFNLPVDRQVS
jgi:hypothetical protein